MSLEMIKQNANSLLELIENYNKLVEQQLFLASRHESSEKINEINGKLLQLRVYFLKIIANIDTLVTQEEKLLGKMPEKGK